MKLVSSAANTCIDITDNTHCWAIVFTHSLLITANSASYPPRFIYDLSIKLYICNEDTRTFMATPRTLGQQFLFALYLWYARPAFNTGLSMRPPPATMPDSNRHHYSTTSTYWVHRKRIVVTSSELHKQATTSRQNEQLKTAQHEAVFSHTDTSMSPSTNMVICTG